MAVKSFFSDRKNWSCESFAQRKNIGFVANRRKGLCKLGGVKKSMFFRKTPLWKNLWKVWKTSIYQQEFDRFKHCPKTDFLGIKSENNWKKYRYEMRYVAFGFHFLFPKNTPKSWQNA